MNYFLPVRTPQISLAQQYMARIGRLSIRARFMLYDHPGGSQVSNCRPGLVEERPFMAALKAIEIRASALVQGKSDFTKCKTAFSSIGTH
jgi:hypothetical protein